MTLGPVQLLVVSFPEPNFTGRIITELNLLREAELVRLIDVVAVQKTADGELVALQWSDLSVDEAEDLGATVGALIGLGRGDADAVAAGARVGRDAGADGHLIDDSEVWNVADSIEEGGAALIALIEHSWAAPLRDAILEAGGVPVSDGWVHPMDLVEIGLASSVRV
jgi:uncharacterized membrane protein